MSAAAASMFHSKASSPFLVVVNINTTASAMVTLPSGPPVGSAPSPAGTVTGFPESRR
jgi:hypothetical protein